MIAWLVKFFRQPAEDDQALVSRPPPSISMTREPHTISPDPGSSAAKTKETVPTPRERTRLQSISLVLTCTTAMIVYSASISYVQIAGPVVARELDIPIPELTWLVTSYALTSGCFLLTFGRIADLYGRKKVFMAGSLSVAVFSIACGFAQTRIALYVLRAFQGIGTAATIPASMGILAKAFPPSKARAVAFATFSAGNPLGAGLGMVMGGILTQLSSWRANFYLFGGITCLCLIGGAISIDPDHGSTELDKRIDWIGSLLITLSLIFITFALGQGELAPQQWSTPYIFAILMLGVIMLVLFLLWQTRLERIMNDPNAPHTRWTPPPIMKPSLWLQAKGRVAALMWIAFFTWCVFRSWAYWAQLYYQDYLLLTPIQTMLRILPMFITGVLCNVFMAQVSGRVPVVYLVVIGAIMTSASSLLFAVIDPSVTYWAFGFPAAVFSVWGTDFVFTSGTLLIAKTVALSEQSLAGGVFQTMTQIGTALTVPVTTIVYNSVVQREQAKATSAGTVIADAAQREINLSGYRAAQWCAFGFGIIAAILGFISLRGVGIVGHRDPPKEKHVDIEKQSVASTHTYISDADTFSMCGSDIDTIISVPSHNALEVQLGRRKQHGTRERDVAPEKDPSIRQQWDVPTHGKRDSRIHTYASDVDTFSMCGSDVDTIISVPSHNALEVQLGHQRENGTSERDEAPEKDPSIRQLWSMINGA